MRRTCGVHEPADHTHVRDEVLEAGHCDAPRLHDSHALRPQAEACVLTKRRGGESERDV